MYKERLFQNAYEIVNYFNELNENCLNNWEVAMFTSDLALNIENPKNGKNEFVKQYIEMVENELKDCDDEEEKEQLQKMLEFLMEG